MSAKDTPERQDAVAQSMFERLFNIAPATRSYPVCTRPALFDDLDAAEDRLRTASEDEKAKVSAEVEAIRAAIADATVSLRFEAIGSIPYDDLVGAHPPTDQQKKRDLQWNPETFSVAVIAASLAEPKLTEEEVRRMLAQPGWSSGLATVLYMEAVAVNQTVRRPDLPKG